jgi:hypothetical protein
MTLSDLFISGLWGEEESMRTFTIAFTMAFILAILATPAKAREYLSSKMIFGAGSGPVLGQVMGGGGEITLLGTEVDDMFGNTGESGKGRDGDGEVEGLARPVFFIPPVPRPVFPHQSAIICREFIVTEGRHGDFREVTKTVCQDRHGRYIDRPDWRGDDRRQWRDDDRQYWRDDRWQDQQGRRGGRDR